jgi:hypothetical protein
MERHLTSRLEVAQNLALGRLDIALIDRDLHWAERFVKDLRSGRATRRLSIAVLARGDFDPAELALIQAGANSVLRLPADPEWDKRLARLVQVAVRRQARFPVQFQVDAGFLGEAEVAAAAINLSETGMLIECRQLRLQVGSELHFAFQFPEQPGLISGRARVARVAGAHQFGIEFTDLEGEFLQRIRGFMEALARG